MGKQERQQKKAEKRAKKKEDITEAQPPEASSALAFKPQEKPLAKVEPFKLNKQTWGLLPALLKQDDGKVKRAKINGEWREIEVEA